MSLEVSAKDSFANSSDEFVVVFGTFLIRSDRPALLSEQFRSGIRAAWWAIRWKLRVALSTFWYELSYGSCLSEIIMMMHPRAYIQLVVRHVLQGLWSVFPSRFLNPQLTSSFHYYDGTFWRPLTSSSNNRGAAGKRYPYCARACRAVLFRRLRVCERMSSTQATLETFSGAIIDPQRRFVANVAWRAAEERGRALSRRPCVKPDAHLQTMPVFGW